MVERKYAAAIGFFIEPARHVFPKHANLSLIVVQSYSLAGNHQDAAFAGIGRPGNKAVERPVRFVLPVAVEIKPGFDLHLTTFEPLGRAFIKTRGIAMIESWLI